MGMDFQQHTILRTSRGIQKLYLQCFNNFFGKAYQDETKCQQFLRKEMQALQKK